MEGELNPACGDTGNAFALITGLTQTSRHVCLVPSFTRTRAFRHYRHPCAERSSSALYGVALKRHTVPEPQVLEHRAKRARAAGMSPAAHALRSDVVRRAASRGGTLRCAEARRVAYRDVDKSYASHRLG